MGAFHIRRLSHDEQINSLRHFDDYLIEAFRLKKIIRRIVYQSNNKKRDKIRFQSILSRDENWIHLWILVPKVEIEYGVSGMISI